MALRLQSRGLGGHQAYPLRSYHFCLLILVQTEVGRVAEFDHQTEAGRYSGDNLQKECQMQRMRSHEVNWKYEAVQTNIRMTEAIHAEEDKAPT